MRNKRFTALTLALTAVFLAGLWKLFDLRFELGDVYPPYSTLRADPLGAKAFHDALQQVQGTTVQRNYGPLPKIAEQSATIFLLGQDPFEFQTLKEDKLKEFEALAARGNRVVIAFRPIARVDPKKASSKDLKIDKLPIETRWAISFDFVKRDSKDDSDDGENPKITALRLLTAGLPVDEVERHFGSGMVVLLPSSYGLGNEALADERDMDEIADALGTNRTVVFDESHLGIRESSGVATLARKYHLQGAAAVLLILLALFIWKSSTSFLPVRDTARVEEDGIEARDTTTGLANLLRRNIPQKDVMKTCLEAWEASQHGGKFYPQSKLDRVRAAAHAPRDPNDVYEAVAKILVERNRE